MPSRSIIREKELIKERLIGFQREIADLKQAANEQKKTFDNWRKDLLLDLLEVMDTIENIDSAYAEKEDGLDKTARRILKSARNLGRKIERILEARDIVPIEIPGGQATEAHCRIVDTKPMPGAPCAQIISVEKRGYIDRKANKVLRKADVITVRNPESAR